MGDVLISIPEVIKTHWHGLDWDVAILRALDLPAEDMPLSELSWHLDVPLWPHKGIQYALAPREVIKAPQVYRDQCEKILSADLRVPLQVTFFRKRWLMLDGCWRLAKAYLHGRSTIRVCKVPLDLLQS